MTTIIVNKLITQLEYTADTQSLERAETAVQELVYVNTEQRIRDRAKCAGQRAASRALLRGESTKRAVEIELAKCQEVQARLTHQLQETGQLPPGVIEDLAEAVKFRDPLSEIENAALATNGVEKVRVTKREFSDKPYPYRIVVDYEGTITKPELYARIGHLRPAGCELVITKVSP